MSSSDSSRASGSGRWWSGLLATGLVGVLLAVAANWYATPRVAEEIFRRTPVDAVLDLEERRVAVTRRFTLAMLAGMLGPAPDASPGSGSGSNDGAEPDEPEPGGEGSRDDNRESSDGDPKARGEASSDEGRRQRASASDDSPGSEPSESADPGATDVPSETPEYTVDRRELNQRLRKPERVRDKIAVVPDRQSGGKPRGLRIQKFDGWFGEFGLHVGDVVRAINGVRVTTRQQALGTLMGMRDQTTFTLDVLRRDKQFQIRYHVPHIDK